ncbi:dnaJ homolog subfamily C member 30, mitochondrial-like [Gigantopelta aegis]|uniref:dnaJ homolog subfamily C member 30, mitochondrial-like n=1 Tax=Gigantopelta aegis TaxID=1735272 RepID=UPI001B88BE62|nr:dnaJ homolog subfamily C member 30, mitochondrial-like [Gigantopelta aegis]
MISMSRNIVLKKCHFRVHLPAGIHGMLWLFIPHVVQNRHYAARSKTFYYDVLGIPINATQGQIKTAYYTRSKMYHPDVNKDADSERLFSDISEAYEILGNVRKRRLYDQGLGQRYQFEETYPKRDPFVGKKRGSPPTGRTSTYNFDEFYRMHYSDVRKKKQNFKAFEEKWKAELKEERQLKIVSYIITGAFMGSVFGWISFLMKQQNK